MHSSPRACVRSGDYCTLSLEWDVIASVRSSMRYTTVRTIRATQHQARGLIAIPWALDLANKVFYHGTLMEADSSCESGGQTRNEERHYCTCIPTDTVVEQYSSRLVVEQSGSSVVR